MGLIAGGQTAAMAERETAANNYDLGAFELQSLDFSNRDMLLALTVSGKTPWVWGAMRHAWSLGAPIAVITQQPTSEAAQLADIAIASAETWQAIAGEAPRVAMLSFSTHGSARHPCVANVQQATEIVRQRAPQLMVDGELQFDAAVSPKVAHTKCPGSSVAGHANTFIFPDINAGNIGYKIAQRLGNFEAYGPILLGLNAPINDLSRGCNAAEVYSMAIITAALA